MRGWQLPWVGPAGAFRHMTCACGVEAWVKKEKGKKSALFSFRTKPEHEFRQIEPQLDDDW